MKVSTWNIQGQNYNNAFSSYTEAKNRMLNNEIDVLCLQEAGNLFNIIPCPRWEILNNGLYCIGDRIGSQSRGADICVYYAPWGNVNERCSLAILVKQSMNLWNSAIFFPEQNCRPVIGFVTAENVAVYNIHAPSSNNAANFVKKALTNISYLHQTHNNLFQHIILTGDFNCNPSEVMNFLYHNPILNYRCYAPVYKDKFVPTQKSGNCLDYCVASKNVTGVEILNENSAYSDHLQVIFNL